MPSKLTQRTYFLLCLLMRIQTCVRWGSRHVSDEDPDMCQMRIQTCVRWGSRHVPKACQTVTSGQSRSSTLKMWRLKGTVTMKQAVMRRRMKNIPRINQTAALIYSMIKTGGGDLNDFSILEVYDPYDPYDPFLGKRRFVKKSWNQEKSWEITGLYFVAGCLIHPGRVLPWVILTIKGRSYSYQCLLFLVMKGYYSHFPMTTVWTHRDRSSPNNSSHIRPDFLH